MNQHDRDNLEFLLNASPEVLEDWYNQADDNDIEYAAELLALVQAELDEHILSLQLEKQNVFVFPMSDTIH